MSKTRQKALWTLASIALVFIFLAPLFIPDYKAYVMYLLQTYPYFAPITVIGIRFLTIIIAPLPGVQVSFASMAFLPWQEAWLYNLIAVESGSVCAFLIARKFREPVVKYFTPLDAIRRFQKTISHRKQFWGFVALRLVSISAFDFVSYAAGLSVLPFKSFFVASLLIDVPASFIFFYMGGQAMKYGVYIFAVFAALFFITVAVSTGFFVKNIKEKVK